MSTKVKGSFTTRHYESCVQNKRFLKNVSFFFIVAVVNVHLAINRKTGINNTTKNKRGRN